MDIRAWEEPSEVIGPGWMYSVSTTCGEIKSLWNSGPYPNLEDALRDLIEHLQQTRAVDKSHFNLEGAHW